MVSCLYWSKSSKSVTVHKSEQNGGELIPILASWEVLEKSLKKKEQKKH